VCHGCVSRGWTREDSVRSTRTHFGPMLADREGKMMARNDEGVKAINTMPKGVFRFTAPRTDSNLVLEFAQCHPKLFDPDRPRFEIM
jgi:hypothetical protein